MNTHRTLRYLSSTAPKRGYDGDEPVPAALYTDPTFVRRLSYKQFPANPNARARLPETIATVPSEVAFFLDTSMWDLTLEPDIWTALLSRRNSVFVIPNVHRELQGWITAHPAYVGSQAITDQRSPLVFQGLPGRDTDDETAWVYYTYLLQTRRHVLNFFRMMFHEKRQRDPTPAELVQGAQTVFGERGLALVHKDGKSVTVDRRATDESLVYFAAAHAVETGRPTVILTKDQDVLEQFYKLWWFWDTHYRAMLLADKYVSDPLRFRTWPLPDCPRVREAFEMEKGILVDLGAERMNAVLPPKFTFVSAECWVVGKAMTCLVFGAEREMRRLLQVKGATGGLVSSELSGRNLHPWLAPLQLDARMCDYVAVVKDRLIPVPGSRAKVGLFDAWHAVNNKERFTRIVAEPKKPKSGLWVPKGSTGPPWTRK